MEGAAAIQLFLLVDVTENSLSTFFPTLLFFSGTQNRDEKAQRWELAEPRAGTQGIDYVFTYLLRFLKNGPAASAFASWVGIFHLIVFSSGS